jgi:hypothetical protein
MGAEVSVLHGCGPPKPFSEGLWSRLQSFTYHLRPSLGGVRWNFYTCNGSNCGQNQVIVHLCLLLLEIRLYLLDCFVTTALVVLGTIVVWGPRKLPSGWVIGLTTTPLH